MDFVGILLPLVFAVLVLALAAKLIAGAADGNREASRTTDGRLEFAPNRRSFWGVYLFIAFMVYAMIGSLAHGMKGSGDLFVPVSALGFIAFLLAAFPATIVSDKDGIEQRYWLRGRKRIAWKDVRSVTVAEKSGEVKIKSKNGATIMHTKQLPDRARLLEELDEHCAEKLVPAAQASKTLAMSGPAA